MKEEPLKKQSVRLFVSSPGVVRLKRGGLIRFMRKFRDKERLYKEGRIGEDELIRSTASLIGHVGHGRTKGMRRRFLYGE